MHEDQSLNAVTYINANHVGMVAQQYFQLLEGRDRESQGKMAGLADRSYLSDVKTLDINIGPTHMPSLM